MKYNVRRLSLDRNFLILVIASVGMLPELVGSGGYYIEGDITHQLLPFVYETKRMLATGVPFWSWNTCFGDNFIASYAYYSVFNPFTWINCLFPYKYLGIGFTFVLYLKFLVCGFVAQKYLIKIGFDRRLSLIGCILYTFSSWGVSNLLFYFFIEPMILLPFLLIFVERFLGSQRHAYSGLAMATCVVVFINFYFSTINLFVAIIYFFCRLKFISNNGKERLKLSLGATGCIFLGIICASAVLIPVMLQMRGYFSANVKRDSFDVFMWLDRIFWLIYPKAHEGSFYYIFLNSGWKSNAVGIPVFGILPTVLIFRKKGYGWIKWLTALLAIFYFTPLNGVFSLFTDYYYTRWAYALTLSFIVCTLCYIRDFGMPLARYACWYVLVVYGFYFFIVFVSIFWHSLNSGDYAPLRITRLAMDAILIVVNAVALLLLCWRIGNVGSNTNHILVAVVTCTAFQFLVYSMPLANWFSSDSKEFTETEYFISGEDFRTDDEFWFRTNFKVINTGGRPSCNFGLICNRPSIETYHSVQNSMIQKWNCIVGDSVFKQRVFYPRRFTRSFEALMSVKHIIVVSSEQTDSSGPGRYLYKKGLFRVYESDHFIPMGFAYDRYVLSDSIEKIFHSNGHVDIPKLVLSSLAIRASDESELSQYLSKGAIDPNLQLDSLVLARRSIACDRFKGHTMGFDAHISLDTSRVIFFSVLADNGFSAYIDGEPTKIYETNLGFSSVIVAAGNHDISFRYFTPGLSIGLILSAMGLVVLMLMFMKRL